LRLRMRAAMVEGDCLQATRAHTRHEALEGVAAARRSWWRALVRRACVTTTGETRPSAVD
jgi:hypothetical protein